MTAYVEDQFLSTDSGPLRVLLFVAFLVGIVFLLGKPVRTAADAGKRLAEIVIGWVVIQLLSAGYYTLFGDYYLNQLQQGVFTLLYAVLRSNRPPRQRMVMGCAAWAGGMLIISISGSSGGGFSVLTVLLIAVADWSMLWFLHRFAVSEFSLSPRYWLIVIGALTLTGAIASSNWLIDPGFSAYYLTLDSVLLALLLLVYYLFYHLSEIYTRNMEMTAQQMQRESEEQLLALSRKNYEEMQMLRHEIKNHDAYIRMLVGSHRFEELERYTGQEIGLAADLLEQVSCGNQVIDAVVNYELALARLKEVRLRTELLVPSSLPFADADLFSLLANLLTNGIESAAAAHVAKPTVQLQLRQQQRYLFIHMENPVDRTVDAAQRLQLHTTKENQKVHGYGTRVIRRITERYNGYVQYDIQDGVFYSDIMLAMGEEHRDETNPDPAV